MPSTRLPEPPILTQGDARGGGDDDLISLHRRAVAAHRMPQGSWTDAYHFPTFALASLAFEPASYDLLSWYLRLQLLVRSTVSHWSPLVQRPVPRFLIKCAAFAENGVVASSILASSYCSSTRTCGPT